jgi:CubicO group peptidase (beta-lactamase class C family)
MPVVPVALKNGLVLGTVCLLLAASSALAQAPTRKNTAPEVHLTSDKAIEKLLAPIREKYKVPWLIAGIVDEHGIKTIAAVGFRKFASPEPLLVNDKLRIGSCTMTMTATQIAMLVGEKKLSWQSTIGEILADLKPPLHPDFQKVTIHQLLTHRSGLPAEGPYDQPGTGTNIERRAALVRLVLSQPPAYAPGTKSLHSPSRPSGH